MAEPNAFPVNDAPEPITRKFPDFGCVDGLATNTLSIVRVPDQPDDIYHFAVWSSFGEESFRVSPRQDIDMTLKALNLPPSRYLIYNHTVLKEDDLDTELDYADHNSYGFVIQIDRLEFQAYYNMIVSSPLVQDRFDDMLLVWNWRHVPVRDGDDCNFLVFHIPEGPNDVTGPLTYDEMVELFREHYQGYTPTGRLRLLVDCDAGQDGNIFITEYFPDEDSEDVQRFSRTLVLPNSEYVVTTYMNDILFGFRVRMQIPSGEPADASTDGYQVPIGLNDDLEFPVFGAPDQVISLEDLFGPDFK